ncbi:unnamed protein product [Pleuronectes platessa]|uniref:Uncharacterized protein n=1 Tax=Pleuronectes platessa TaxID=8262 RepID=A0A9N7UML3_PLEPL|nr:unnamed protein product [Pleuronectes platessa]
MGRDPMALAGVKNAEKHREKKLKSLEVEAAKCAKLTDLFGAGFTSPAAAPGDERGGLDKDERVEADMVDHLTCESLRSCSPSVHVRGLALCLPPLPAFTVDHLTCESLRVVFQTQAGVGNPRLYSGYLYSVVWAMPLSKAPYTPNICSPSTVHGRSLLCVYCTRWVKSRD